MGPGQLGVFGEGLLEQPLRLLHVRAVHPVLALDPEQVEFVGR